MNHAITIQKLKLVFNNYTGKNITFRNFTKSDLFPLFKATENPLFNKYLTWEPKDEVDLNLEVKRLLNEAQFNRAVVVSVCEKYTGKWAGFIKFIPSDDGLEVSLWIHPDFWNSKIGFKSVAYAFQIVFNNSNIENIYCRIQKGNMSVKRVVDLLNFDYVEDVFIPHENGSSNEGMKYILNKSKFIMQNELMEY